MSKEKFVTEKLENPVEIKKRVCIMGFAPSWVDTPFNDQTIEIWTLNEAYRALQAKNIPIQRINRWFEIHNPKSPSKNIPEHVAFLRQCPVPVYMNNKYDDIPNCIEYPREKIKEYFNHNFIADNGIGSKFTEYSNSISWMVALAIYEGYEEIWVTGVDMAQTDEYAWQRSSCEFFIGFAVGKGIKICIPQNSELCKFPQDYGWETDNQTRIKMKNRKKELTQRKLQIIAEIQKAQAKIKEFEASVFQLEGAIQEINYNLSNHIV